MSAIELGMNTFTMCYDTFTYLVKSARKYCQTLEALRGSVWAS